MREPKTKMINDNEWVVHPWHGILGLKIQAKLAKMLTPALMVGNSDVKSIMNKDFSMLASSVAELFDEDEAPNFVIKQLLHGTRINGKDMSTDANFNEHFSANFAELYQGLVFVFQVNFEDFTKLAGVIMTRVQTFTSHLQDKFAEEPETKNKANKGKKVYRES
jgi:tRNA isopentenyl-2-thiomethyl-A-37 hydroxylase MiaE